MVRLFGCSFERFLLSPGPADVFSNTQKQQMQQKLVFTVYHTDALEHSSIQVQAVQAVQALYTEAAHFKDG